MATYLEWGLETKWMIHLTRGEEIMIQQGKRGLREHK